MGDTQVLACPGCHRVTRVPGMPGFQTLWAQPVPGRGIAAGKEEGRAKGWEPSGCGMGPPDLGGVPLNPGVPPGC